jgi:hypothetical protein
MPILGVFGRIEIKFFFLIPFAKRKFGLDKMQDNPDANFLSRFVIRIEGRTKLRCYTTGVIRTCFSSWVVARIKIVSTRPSVT